MGSVTDAVKENFNKAFSVCNLTEIAYAGYETTRDHKGWTEGNGKDEVIVSISSLEVDSSGGDGSLKPNTMYTDWLWILVRNHGSKWKHVCHGY